MKISAVILLCLIVMVISACNSAGVARMPPADAAKSAGTEPAIKYTGRLPFDEVKRILSGGVAGYFTVREGDRPLAVPVLYEYSVELQRIYIRGVENDDARVLEALRKDSRVIFTVDKHTDIPARRAHASEPTPTSWTSIHIFGTARARTKDIEIIPEVITAKRVGMSEFQGEHAPMMILDKTGKALDVVAPLPQDNPKVTAYRAKDAHLENPPVWVNGDNGRALTESILYRNLVGRLHTIGTEYPYSVPVNHTYYNGRIYIHSRGATSLKILNIQGNPNVCYTTEWFGNNIPWISVLVSGQARLIYADDEEYRKVGRVIMNRLQGSADDDPSGAEMSAAGSGAILIEITPEIVSLKTITIPSETYYKMPGTKTEKGY